jgi:hypothetical protein
MRYISRLTRRYKHAEVPKTQWFASSAHHDHAINQAIGASKPCEINLPRPPRHPDRPVLPSRTHTDAFRGQSLQVHRKPRGPSPARECHTCIKLYGCSLGIENFFGIKGGDASCTGDRVRGHQTPVEKYPSSLSPPFTSPSRPAQSGRQALALSLSCERIRTRVPSSVQGNDFGRR